MKSWELKTRNIIFAFTMLVALLLCTDISAQRRRGGQQYGARPEKKVHIPDSLELARRDSLHVADKKSRRAHPHSPTGLAPPTGARPVGFCGLTLIYFFRYFD